MLPRSATRIVSASIGEALLQRVYVEARNSYPAECCGWLSGPKNSSQATAVRPCHNARKVQSCGSHANTPANTAFLISGLDLLALNRELDGENPPLLIYHSHSDGRAYLSQTDRRAATNPFGDGPMYPVQQLVIGIDDQKVNEAALYAWSYQRAVFLEIRRFAGAKT